MECPKCGYEAAEVEFGIPAKCPECGAYREKALAHKKRRESAQAAPPKQSQIKARLSSARSAAKDSRAERAKGSLYCTDCGTRSNGVRKARGSMLAELVLWLCFIVPGIIYSAWRLSSKYTACTACGSTAVIPISSPKARRELERI